MQSIAEADSGTGLVAGRYVVILKDNASPDAVLADHGLTPTQVYRYALNGFAVPASAAQAAALKADPRVAELSQDRMVGGATDQTVPTGVSRIGDSPTVPGAHGGAGVRIAVVDSGISYNHPDLVANIDGEHSCNFIGGLDCGAGAPPVWDDGHGHGTHVSGIIAARNNSEGVVGVAPRATLVALRVLDNTNSGVLSDATAAIDYVTCTRVNSKCHKHGNGPVDANDELVPPIDIVNMSLTAQCPVCTVHSSDPTVKAFEKAIKAATDSGVVVVVAAGNAASEVSTTVPAAFVDPITVSSFIDFNGQGGPSSGCQLIGTATVCDETMSPSTNYGKRVDLAAPGVLILSTDINGGYRTRNGTSMAAAHVTGIVALMIQNDVPLKHDRNVEKVVTALKRSGECPDGSINGTGQCKTSWSSAQEHKEPLVNAPRAVAKFN